MNIRVELLHGAEFSDYEPDWLQNYKGTILFDNYFCQKTRFITTAKFIYRDKFIKGDQYSNITHLTLFF